ncbi:MAG: M23 family metallopeptidase [Bacteroidota bacterium]|nr:M23 family metallopeptidase [Bacteroidota bacterium]
MKSFCYSLFALFLLFTGSLLHAQNIYPTQYFRRPLDLPMALSGAFGEIRPNHLHSGIDLRTNQQEGYPVHAVANGYVSRIHVQAFGFGYSLYIDHPNGYTSVYGHLKQYNDKITAWLKQKQYELQEFEVDLFPKPDELPVFKDDIVALTGSSGVSGGPHLHYEIRNTLTEYPINPLLFGYHLTDTIPPRIKSIRIMPVKGRGRINGKAAPIDLLVTPTADNKYKVSSPRPIILSGEITFGIDASDLQNGNEIPTGVYTYGFYKDDACYTSLRMETFSFKQNRAANSVLDYAECMKTGHCYVRSFVEPWNPLKIYDQVKNNGIFNFNDDLKHEIKIEVKDFQGNTSSVLIPVMSKASHIARVVHAGYQKVFYGNRNNIYATPNMKISILRGGLYDTLYFRCKTLKANRKLVSAVYSIQDKFTPAHEYFTLSLKTKPLKPELRDKAVMVRIDDDGSLNAVGGDWLKGFMVARVNNFGKYGVAVDTVPPVIIPLTSFSKKTYLENGVIQFRISDNLSGIKTFHGYLNGKWVLMSLDGKSGKLTLDLEGITLQPANTLRIELEDHVGNKTIFEKTFEN